jgi:hypothetical protein
MSKPYPSSDDLICLSWIYRSHDDYVEFDDSIYLGFDKNQNLVIVCEYKDYVHDGCDCATYVQLDRAEALRLAGIMELHLKDLPQGISDFMSDWWCDSPDAKSGTMRDCFQEIVERLTEEGCYFKTFRKRSRHGKTAY